MISPINETGFQVGALLLAAPDASARASLVASAVVELLPDSACAVYWLSVTDDEASWTIIGLAGEISAEQTELGAGNRLIAPLLSAPDEILVYPGSEVEREDFSHLHVPHSIASIAYIPLTYEDQLTGALEILSFAEPIDAAQIEELGPILQMAPPAILAAEKSEQQRQTLLDSVHRMTQLYDLEKSLNATLDMDAVTLAIPTKAAAMLPCQAVHLWLYDGGVLRLVSSCGDDPTVDVGITQAPGEGYVADMAEEGEPLLIDDPDDPRLVQRNAAATEENGIPPITNALLVPLIQDEAEVGVLEAVNRDDGPFDDDDLFFLTSMSETVASALKNASLMLSERKLAILEALVHVSSEITSTLRLDRLLQIIVNSPQNVLPYELCAIALDHRGRLQLKAVSGMSSLPMGDPQVERVLEILRWLSTQNDSMYLRMHGEEDANLQQELPAAVKRHFEETGFRGLYSLPLTDDQGRVGLLLYESSVPDFLSLPHTEMIKILAGQATVAIRNALLYREVPLISLIEPLMQKKASLLRTSSKRRLVTAVVAAAIVLFLLFCPMPMRVTGDALIAPLHLVTIAAPVDGNVQAVYVHEGQRVAAGDVLAALNDWQWRTDLASADAKYQAAMLTMEDDLAHGSAQSGADRAQAEFLRAEVARISSRLQSAQLRSPIDGIVVTPNLENVAGKHLLAGDTFAQVLDLKTAVVRIAVSEADAALLAPGQHAAVKLDSFPQQTWHDSVSLVSPEAQVDEGKGERNFVAEVPVANTNAMLRDGMSGKGKVFIGWRPAGYVLLRRPRSVAVADSMELDWLVTRMLPRCFCLSLSGAVGAFAAAALLLAVAGCDSHPQVAGVSASATPAESSPVAPPPASTQSTAASDPKSFSTTGPLVADQQADIAAEREGRVVSIAVQIGDRVKRGQLLASLDDRVLRSACDAQKARIASAKAQETEWESEEQTARSDLRRSEQMLANKIISQETWEHAKYRVDETVAEVDHYRNEEAASEADLATANLQLEQSRIVAPFSGVVGRSSARLAQQVKAGDVLFWITAEAPLRVLFTVPESVMAGFTVGKPLDITTSIYPGLHQSGRIFRVSPVVDPASASVQVIGAVDHPSPMLKPGMSMQVRLAP